MDTTHQVQPGNHEPEAARLLLFSLADFWNLIEPLLAAAAPKTICEIGMGNGDFTTVLLEFCQRNHCGFCGIDPAAEPALVQGREAAQIVKQPSLSALPGLPAQDVYFVDGDHNYYTVLNELRLIAHGADRWPLIILHDVCWPWGRRDHYFSPESIPETFRQPYSTSLEMPPGRKESAPGAYAHVLNFLGGLANQPGGLTGGASTAVRGVAAHEGGPRNGVLTAVEDFLREQPEAQWKLAAIPAVFGLGILYAPAKCPPEVLLQLDRIETSIATLQSLLELLERNRVDLLTTHLRQTKQLEGIHDEYAKLMAAYEKLNEHAGSLLQQYGALAAHCDTLTASFNALQQKFQAVKKPKKM